MTFLDAIKHAFQPAPPERGPAAGLYHYAREDGEEKSRVHLQIDPDGTGTLIINANRVMHLNPTACLMAWSILEGRTKEEQRLALTSRYAISKRQAESDLEGFHQQLQEVIRPDGACPIHELELDTTMPFSSRPSAPYRMDLAITYRCNNDCAHCYNARARNYPELGTEQWFKILDDLWALGVPHIVFTGGEATLREDLPDLIRHAEANGQITGLNTNAAPPGGHGLREQTGGGGAGPCAGHGRILRRGNPR